MEIQIGGGNNLKLGHVLSIFHGYWKYERLAFINTIKNE